MLSLGLDADVSWRAGAPPAPAAAAVEERQITLADFPQLLLNPPTAAGVAVTEATALNFSAYFNGVDVISSQIAAFPRIPYRRLDNDERERVTGQPLSRILEQPNPAMTDFVFWQTLVAHVLTWGNGYAEIEFDRALRPIALWPITPDRIQPLVLNNRVVYKYSGRSELIEAEDILHVPGLGFNGIKGYSVVQKARQSLGLALAAERFGGGFFGGGAWPGVLLEHPKTLTAGAAARLKAGWDQLFRGPDRAHGTAVLEEGMKANKLGIPPDDAQFLQTREFQVVEVARWLNLPVHKLKQSVGARPGGNLESSQIEFLTDTLRPWMVRIEQELVRKLVIPAQRSTYYVEHLADSILRMDGVARATSYKVYFDMGVLDAEQIAAKENLPKPKPKPPAPAPPAAVPPPPPEPAAEDAPPPASKSRMLSADRANLTDAAARFVRREASAARRAAKRGPEAFAAWVEQFYQDETPVLRGFLVHAVRLSLACRGLEGDADKVSGQLAAAYAERSREELLGLPAKDLEERAEKLVARWETGRAADLAEQVLALRPDEMRAAAAAAPTVNVTVVVPEQPAPNVTIESHNHVPAAPPPAITVAAPVVHVDSHNTVQVPQAAPPVVQVDNHNVVQVPRAAALKVERDIGGNITGIVPTKG